MKYLIRCKECGAEVWIHGHEETDVNALILDDNDPNWDFACTHLREGGESDTIDAQYPDEEDTWHHGGEEI